MAIVVPRYNSRAESLSRLNKRNYRSIRPRRHCRRYGNGTSPADLAMPSSVTRASIRVAHVPVMILVGRVGDETTRVPSASSLPDCSEPARQRTQAHLLCLRCLPPFVGTVRTGFFFVAWMKGDQ